METGFGIPERFEVFVVYSDLNFLESVSFTLRGAGFNVRAFDLPLTFLAQHDPRRKGCIVTDIHMAGLDGLELQKQLSQGMYARPMIFCTSCRDPVVIVRAIKAGAIDYIIMPPNPLIAGADVPMRPRTALPDGVRISQKESLVAAVRNAEKIDQELRVTMDEMHRVQVLYEQLTAREREVMALVVRGRLNKQIAHELGTVEKTIKVHRAHLMEKLRVSTLAALVHLSHKLPADWDQSDTNDNSPPVYGDKEHAGFGSRSKTSLFERYPAASVH